MSQNKLFQFGYVSRAHGLNGEVVVRTFDPTSAVLDEVQTVLARLKDGAERTLVVQEHREGPGGDLLVTFKGMRRREEADQLRGAGLFVKRADLEPPADGEYFQGDLVGMLVKTPEGVTLGRVTELWNSGPVPNLVIVDEAAGELMVPFAEDFVKSVDLAERLIILVKPEFEGG